MKSFFYIFVFLFCFLFGWYSLNYLRSCQKEQTQISELTRLKQIKQNVPEVLASVSLPAENLPMQTAVPISSMTPNPPLGTNQIDDSDSNVLTDEADDEQDWLRPEVEDEMKE